MQIIVDRYISDADTTISRIWLNGEHVCYGLEDEHREQKRAGETRIPAGSYRVELRQEGGFHQRYQSRFPEFHEGMLHVVGVPNFEYILIHIGNHDDHTDGCLLVGSSADTSTGKMCIQQSENAYRKLYPLVVKAAKRGVLSIVYQDNDIQNDKSNDPTHGSQKMGDKKRWYERLLSFAPAAATAISNPAAGGAMALKVIAGKLGVAEDKAEVEAAIDRMEDSELKLKLKGLDLEFHKASLDSHLAIVSAEERIQLGAYEVAKVEAASNDQYVRRTRPMIARWSFYAGAAYCLAAELIHILALIFDEPKAVATDTAAQVVTDHAKVITAFGEVLGKTGADPMIAAALFAPCMAYIGARTFDKAKPFNK